MRRNALTALVLALLALLAACTDGGEQQRLQLAELERQNRADSLMTNDSLARDLADWFDRHGTANERLLAHYLLARTWTDLGQAPRALDEYHRAAEQADTNSANCDFSILTRIHAQTASLFYEQYMPYEMLTELDHMIASATRDDDTINMLNGKQWKYVAYDMLGQRKNARLFLEDAVNAFRYYGKDSLAIYSYPALIEYFVEERDFKKAKSYIDQYEQHTAYLQTGCPLAGHEIYYYIKGLYYTGTHQYDSARIAFDSCLRSSEDANEQEAAYKGLFSLYRLQGRADTVAKYAVLCYETSDSSFRESSSDKLRHMQALYNYNHSQQVAFEKTKEASRNMIISIVAIASCIIITLSSAYYFSLQRRKAKEKVRILKDDYEHNVELLVQAKNDIIRLKNQETKELLHEKEMEIEHYQSRLNSFETLLSTVTSIEKRIAQTDIYKRFLYLSKHPIVQADKKEWEQLFEMVNKEIPGLRTMAFAHYHPSETEYKICVLTRLHFSLPEIIVLIGATSADLSKKRRSLLKNIFHIEGKPEKLDQLIKNVR